MDKLDKKTIDKGQQLENEINNTSARNRHQAEERNQVELREEDENDNEEVKYSAVDTGNQAAIGKLDGHKKSLITAPQGKWKAFHKKIDKKAMGKMTSNFLQNLSKKDSKDTLLAPNA